MGCVFGVVRGRIVWVWVVWRFVLCILRRRGKEGNPGVGPTITLSSGCCIDGEDRTEASRGNK